MMLTHAHTVATHTRHAHACASRNTHNACIYAHVEPFCCTKSVVQTHISMHVHTRPCTDTHMHTRLFFQPQQVKKKTKKLNDFKQKGCLQIVVCLTQPGVPGGWGLLQENHLSITENYTMLTVSQMFVSRRKTACKRVNSADNLDNY